MTHKKYLNSGTVDNEIHTRIHSPHYWKMLWYSHCLFRGI